MRLGSFRVSGAGGTSADVSVVSFPGSGGDDLANVNRWRNQLQLQPIDERALADSVQSLDLTAGRFAVVDLAGPSAGGKASQRILGAWLRDGGQVWFIKMMGPADLVGTQKKAFADFLASFRLPQKAPESSAPSSLPGSAQGGTNDLPPGHPGVPAAAGSPSGMDSMPVQTAEVPTLRWQAPGDWAAKPASSMRKASYSVGGAEVAITVFPGDVGGVLANVNRWRGQVGLPEISQADLGGHVAAIDTNGLHFTVVDEAGSSARIMAGLLPWQGVTWFFKLTGPPDAVERAKPAFLTFLKTVKAP